MKIPHWAGVIAAAASVFFSSPIDLKTKVRVVDAIRRSHSPCDALERINGDAINFARSSQYKKTSGEYWSAQEQEVRPRCVFSPKCSEDVSQAVFLMTLGGQTKWRHGEANFAVKGGGHTPFAGSANIEDGVTFDLATMPGAGLSEDHKTIGISPGSKWGDVYRDLDPRNLSISGGRASPVGVGGLVTGGGVSFFSPRLGFVCDNVIDFEVVKSNGAVVHANDRENQDLRRALRGGSNNFGIVTSFNMKTFPHGPFWGGLIAYPLKVRHHQFRAFEEFTGNPDYDTYSALIHSYSITASTRTWVVSNNLEYTKDDPPKPYPKVFKPFTDLKIPGGNGKGQPPLEQTQLSNTMRITNLTSLTDEVGNRAATGVRDIFVTSTYGNSAEMMEEVFQLANRTFNNLVDQVPGLTLALSYQPMPPAITGKADQNGGDSLGLDPASDGPMFNVLSTAIWHSEQHDDMVLPEMKKFFEDSDSKAKQLGVYRKYLYLNYAAKWQDAIASYGEESVARLKAASRKYDPWGTFQRQVPGGFKLPR